MSTAQRAGEPLVLIGGGEHASVVADAILAGPDAPRLLGFVDPAPCEPFVQRFGLARLGDDAELAALGLPWAVLAFAAPGSADARARAVARLARSVRGWATVVHPRAVVSPTATLGEGTVVLAGAVVQTGARVGAHAIVNTAAVVEHDALLAEHVHLAPGAVLGGGVRIGARASIGMGAAVRDHVQVGADAVVAMWAVVIRDVAEGVRVAGVPAVEM